MINDTLTPLGVLMETLPIAPPTEAIRAEVEPLVERLIEIARANHDTRQVTLDWLRARFGLDSPGAALEDLAGLDLQAFISEVGKRLPKNALTPGAVKDLSKGYHDQATPLRERLGEATGLERRLAELVNAAYGLTPEEIALLKETAPPRMPQF